MPFSSNSGKDFIKSLNLQAKTILDVGAGSGTYKDLLNLKGKWTALEIWEPYVDKYSLREKYDEVIVGDVRSLDFQKYDVCFLGDVLEHMTVEEAVSVVNKAKQNCTTVIISIPLGHYPQDEYDGNPYEKHVVPDWSHQQVLENFGEPYQFHIDKEIGVYVYKRLKIAVYAISKNEEQFVQRFCESAAQADLILIADTGSTDGTVDTAEFYGAEVPSICISPWRFDKARDAALALIPRDFDVCISLDLDEVMEPGWREEIERVWKHNTTRLRYKFDWGHNIQFYYEKIHHRHGYHWHHPVHEYPVHDQRIKEVYAQTDKLLVSHHPDPTKSRGQYLDLLRMAVKEDPRCPRNAFYFSRELTFYRLWDEALEALSAYLAMPEATWPNERCYAMRLLADCWEAKGDHYQAQQWVRRAAAEAPYTREPWVRMAELAYTRKDWQECFYAVNQALSIKDKALVYTCDPSCWTEKPYDYGSIAAWHLGYKDIALDWCKKALEFNPDDARLQSNLVVVSSLSESS
jgi:glycosyltransferase involved in cell wall biosynthesis